MVLGFAEQFAADMTSAIGSPGSPSDEVTLTPTGGAPVSGRGVYEYLGAASETQEDGVQVPHSARLHLPKATFPSAPVGSVVVVGGRTWKIEAHGPDNPAMWQVALVDMNVSEVAGQEFRRERPGGARKWR